MRSASDIYNESLNKPVEEQTKPMSAVDIYNQHLQESKPAVAPSTQPPPSDDIEEKKKLFYGESAVSAPFQGLPPLVTSPAIAAELGEHLSPESKMRTGIDEFGRPVDPEGKPYFEQEPVEKNQEPTFLERASKIFTATTQKGSVEAVNDTLSKFKELVIEGSSASATGMFLNESLPKELHVDKLDVVSRLIYKAAALGADLPLMIVGATVGGLSGGPIGAAAGGFGILHGIQAVFADRHSKGEVKDFKDFWERLKHATIETAKGEVTGALTAVAPGGLAGQVAVMTGVGAALEGRIPSRTDWIDNLLLVGGLHTATKTAKAFTKEKVQEVVLSKTEIDTIERMISEVEKSSVDQALKVAQESILKEQKKQAVAKYESAMKELKLTEDIAVDYLRAQEDVAKAKTYPVKGTGIKRPKVAKVKKGEVVEDGLKIEPTVEAKQEGSKIKQTVEEPKEAIEPQESIKVTDKTERPKEVEAAIDNALAHDLAKTNEVKKLLEQRPNAYKEDPEVYLQYLINQTNRWRHGEDINITEVKNRASELAVRSEDVKDFFIRPEDHRAFKEFADEVASWIPKQERLKNKQSKTIEEEADPFTSKPDWSDTQLNALIPVGEIPKVVKDYFKSLKSIGRRKEFRNKYVWDKLGYAKDKQGNWYKNVPQTLDDIRFRPEAVQAFEKTGYVFDRLDNTVKDFVVQSAVPEMKDTIFTSEKLPFEQKISKAKGDRGIAGSYYPEVNRIDVPELSAKGKVLDDVKEAYVHERTHDIMNRRLGKKYAGTNIKDAGGEIPYLLDIGEVKARHDVWITKDPKEAKLQPWKSLNNMLKWEAEQLKKQGDIKDVNEYISSGNQLFSGISPKDIADAITKMFSPAKEFKKTFDANRKAKEMNLGKALKQLNQDMTRALIDNNETLFKYVRKHYPEDYQKLVNRFRSAASGQGWGSVLYERAEKEIFGGMNKDVEAATDMYILMRRFKDIYSYRDASKYKHQKGFGPDEAVTGVTFLDMLAESDPQTFKIMSKKSPLFKEVFGNLTQEQLKRVKSSADRYFEWHRKMVDDLVEAGLKTKEEGELLKAHDFRKFKSMRVEKLYDFDYNFNLKDSKMPLTNSGVQSLGRGSAKMIEPDARVVMNEQFRRVYGSIANNVAKQEWAAFAAKHKENGIVSLDKKGGKDNWSPMAYKEAGELKYLYFHPDIAKYLVTKSGTVHPTLSKVLRTAFMNPLTRNLAVGLSPVWATTAGIPMDYTHAIMTSRTWNPDKGKFDMLYSPFLPKASLELGYDMKKTFTDVYRNGPFINKLYEHGLVMPFLTTREGRYVGGTHAPGDFAKFLDLISSHGKKMEMWVRASTAHRVIRQQAAMKGITFEEALNNKDIVYEAVHAARDRMDYNQGGWLVKAIDYNGIPFTNAATLGTRTYWRQAIDNPVDFTVRTAQIMGTAAGLTATAAIMWPEEHKNIREEGNESNIYFPLFPNHLRAVDEYGDEVSFHFKLRVDPGVAFAWKVSKAITETYLYDQGFIDWEPDYWKLTKTLKQLGPTGTSYLPPSIQAGVDYRTNYNWWRDRQMYTDMGGKTLPWPQSGQEGINDPNVSPLRKTVAKYTGLSGPRLDAVKNIIPQNNEFVWAMGGFANMMLDDAPKGEVSDSWLLELAKTPGFNRFIGITRYNKRRYEIANEENDKAAIDALIKNAEYRNMLDGYAVHGTVKRTEILKYINKQPDEKFNKLMGMLEFVENPMYKTLSDKRFWLNFKGSSNDAKVEIWMRMMREGTEKEKAQLAKEKIKLTELGIISREVEDLIHQRTLQELRGE